MTPHDLMASFRESRQDVTNILAAGQEDTAPTALVVAVLLLAWAVVQVAIAIKEAR